MVLPPLELRSTPNAPPPAMASIVLWSLLATRMFSAAPDVIVEPSTTTLVVLPIVLTVTAPAPSKWTPLLPDPVLTPPPPAIAYASISAELEAVTSALPASA
jgi:hypothetical protein